MSILFGHPTGNPNSHNAALAYLEMGLLECFCVSWMPSVETINALKRFKSVRPLAQRLERRRFPQLAHVPKVQRRVREIYRLAVRASGLSNALFSEEANRWLMRTMARECHRSAVTAVHAYEDCSLWQFVEAKRLGKACIYDMPTCYYPSWERTRVELNRTYSDWFPFYEPAAVHDQRLEQKREEMALADLTLVASRYVEATIREFYPYQNIARAPYGVDVEFWTPGATDKEPEPLRFIYAGTVSARKGVPLLVEAWSRADLRNAELALVGSWGLAESKRRSLPRGVTWHPPCSAVSLRARYRASHVFVFPTYSDGFGLALLEAMACGLPAIASEASIGPEIITGACGFISQAGSLDQLVELLRWLDRHRDELPAMGREARAQAAGATWSNYRSLITEAVSKLV
jgi:glycosyltransferase involved in cell wall biosynthesis